MSIMSKSNLSGDLYTQSTDNNHECFEKTLIGITQTQIEDGIKRGFLFDPIQAKDIKDVRMFINYYKRMGYECALRELLTLVANDEICKQLPYVSKTEARRQEDEEQFSCTCALFAKFLYVWLECGMDTGALPFLGGDIRNAADHLVETLDKFFYGHIQL